MEKRTHLASLIGLTITGIEIDPDDGYRRFIVLSDGRHIDTHLLHTFDENGNRFAELYNDPSQEG